MSRRNTTSSKRLERRAERQGRQPGGGTRPSQRRASGGGGRTRNAAPKQFNWLPIAAGVVALVVVGALVYAVTGSTSSSGDSLSGWQKAEQDSSTSLPGTYVPVHPGFDGQYGTQDDRQHFANGVVYPICSQDQVQSSQISNPLCYTSNPPTSGPHAQSPMAFRVLENPAPKENLIHNMEHGGVVIWYNTSNEDVINQLKSITSDSLDRRRLVVMSQYSGMEPDTIAVTAWTRLDKFPVSEFNRNRVTSFIEAHNKRFNPEGF